MELARTRFHLDGDALAYERRVPCRRGSCGDSDELKAAIWNLIDNAMKYSPGEVRVRVVLEAVDDERLASASPTTASAFRPSSSSGSSGASTASRRAWPIRAKGSGLGLFIVRSVAKKHGGRAFAESDGEGQGSTFTLLLPRAPRRERVAQRVLIVEDEQHLAEGLRFNLEAEGFHADVVDTGEAALERLLGDRPPFDLVVLDVMLPGKDGFAVVAELRAAKQFVPVLMLTARGRPEDVLKGFAAGADDYLPKPSELAILLARVGGLLRRRIGSARRRTATRSRGRRSTSTRWSCASAIARCRSR